MVRPAQLEESERLAALPDCGRVAGFAGLALEGELCWLLAERVPGRPLRDALAAGRDCSWRAGCGAPSADALVQVLASCTKCACLLHQLNIAYGGGCDTSETLHRQWKSCLRSWHVADCWRPSPCA